MLNFLKKIIINYIFFLISISLIEGKISKNIELNDILRPNGEYFKKNEIKNINNNSNDNCYTMNNIDFKNNQLSLEENNFTELKIGQNLINNSYLYYKLDLNESNIDEKDLLLYTNLTNNLIYNQTEREGNVPVFDLFFNKDIKNKSLQFKLIPNDKEVHGFLDLKLVNKSEFVLNKNTTREKVYNNLSITLNKSEEKSEEIRKFVIINLIPSDNNSELYYLQFSYNGDIKSKEKENIALYYLNKIDSDTIDGILGNVKRMKRDKKINGKIEIFSVVYKDLDKDEVLKLEYKRIKGEGVIGFIITLSILFALLIIIVVIFLKNTYYGNANKN